MKFRPFYAVVEREIRAIQILQRGDIVLHQRRRVVDSIVATRHVADILVIGHHRIFK